jgi:hypothetical protein
MNFTSNQIKIGPRHRRETVEEIRWRLEWLYENSGEWLHWNGNEHAVPSLREPAFERRVVGSDESRITRVARGLWLRYIGEA